MSYKFYVEHWSTSKRTKVYHASHPDRDAQCGQKWTDESFLGAPLGISYRLCRRCRAIGEGEWP
jgi:hypothetical protein